MKYSSNDIKSLVFKYYQYVIVAVLFIVLVVVLAVFSKKTNDIENENSGSKTQAEQGNTVEIPEVPLEVDKYPEVDEFVKEYLDYLKDGNTDALKEICAKTDDKKLIKIRKKAEFIEEIRNITCYTKPGYEENSYVAYAAYEVKFVNIATPAPGLQSLYIKTNENGDFYICNGSLYGEERTYIRGIMSQQDVVDLMNQDEVDYNNALNSDEMLSRWTEALPDILDKAISDELVEQNKGEEQVEENPETPANVQAKVKDTVNVRKSASEQGEKLGQIMAGDTIVVIANLDNGWSQVDYQGQEAFVKTEFLEIAGEVQQVEAPEGTPEEPQEAAPQESTGDSGKVTVKGTQIRIRDKASTDGEILGAVDEGQTFDKKGEEGDWYKIDYKGNTGYIKKEFTK